MTDRKTRVVLLDSGNKKRTPGVFRQENEERIKKLKREIENIQSSNILRRSESLQRILSEKIRTLTYLIRITESC